MSVMFGKMKTCGSAECNLVLLGVTGSGKSGRSSEPGAVPVLGPRLPAGVQHRQRGQLHGLPAVPADSRLAQQNLPAADSHPVAGQQAGHGPIQVSQCDGEALASRFGCSFFEVSACRDFLSVQHVFHEAVRRARRGGERGRLVPAVYVSEDKAVLDVPSFTTPCYKELPAPATAKLVTVKTSRAQSKRRAATLTLLKGFKIF